MKKVGLLALILAVVMVFAACDSEEEETRSRRQSSKRTATDTTSMFESKPSFPNAELAVECMEALHDASTAEEILPWMVGDDVEEAEDLLEQLKDLNVESVANYRDTFKGYDLFIFNPEDTSNGQPMLLILQRAEDRYLICLSPDVINEVIEAYICETCGGTGLWYNPAAYFDSFMNMWMGQYQACHGCGGSGSTAGTTTNRCTDCDGAGHTL